MSRPRLAIKGDVHVSGGGVSATLSGDGERLVLTVHEATSPRESAMWLSAAASGLRAVGHQLTVTDNDGRLLATAGTGIRSPLGRVLVGSTAVRPQVRNLLRQRRAQKRSPAVTRDTKD